MKMLGYQPSATQTNQFQPQLEMFTNNLVRRKDKLTVPVAVVADHNLELKSLWGADDTRLWDTYSRESFRRFWDMHIPEARSR